MLDLFNCLKATKLLKRISFVSRICFIFGVSMFLLPLYMKSHSICACIGMSIRKDKSGNVLYCRNISGAVLFYLEHLYEKQWYSLAMESFVPIQKWLISLFRIHVIWLLFDESLFSIDCDCALCYQCQNKYTVACTLQSN